MSAAVSLIILSVSSTGFILALGFTILFNYRRKKYGWTAFYAFLLGIVVCNLVYTLLLVVQ